MSRYLDEHRGRFGVESICDVLGVSASAYYLRASAQPSARAVEDERLLGRIRELHAANYYAYGYRRMWIALKRSGEQVGRGRVQRLMREAGIQGAKRRAKRWVTTTPDPAARRRPDLVKRDFTASGPDRLWVADLTYLRCWEGLVFFSFVTPPQPGERSPGATRTNNQCRLGRGRARTNSGSARFTQRPRHRGVVPPPQLVVSPPAKGVAPARPARRTRTAATESSAFGRRLRHQRGCRFLREGKSREQLLPVHKSGTLPPASSCLPDQAGAPLTSATARLLRSVEGAVTRSLWQCAGSDSSRGHSGRFCSPI